MVGFWFSFGSMCTIGYGDYTPLFVGFNFLIELGLLSIGLTSVSLAVYYIAAAANSINIFADRDEFDIDGTSREKHTKEAELRSVQSNKLVI
jgi:hypothetical protein